MTRYLGPGVKLTALILFSLAPFKATTGMSHSDWVQIVRPNITSSLIRYLYPYPPPANIAILDTNIYKAELPELTSNRWMVMSLSQIGDSARRNGEMEFIRLAKSTRLTNSAQVTWEGVKARWLIGSRELIYEVHYRVIESYTLTEGCWRGGVAQVSIFDFLSPRR
jgi:hypothetical protein